MLDLECTIENSDDRPVVYLGVTEPNTLAFRIRNRSGNSLRLRSEDAALALYFDGLFSEHELRSARASAVGWNVALRTDTVAGDYLSFTPVTTLTLAPEETLAVRLRDVVTRRQHPATARIIMNLTGAPDIHASRMIVPVQLQDPPVRGPQPLALRLRHIESESILLSETGRPTLPGQLAFALESHGPQRIPADANTVFTLTLPLGAQGLVAAAAQAAVVRSDGGWRVTSTTFEPVVAPERWHIELRAVENADHIPDGSVLRLQNLEARGAAGIMPVSLTWRNVPGHTAGYTTTTVRREEPRGHIRSLRILTQAAAVPESGVRGRPLRLAWECDGTDVVTLTSDAGVELFDASGTHLVGQTLPASSAGYDVYPVLPDGLIGNRSITITLTAFYNGTPGNQRTVVCEISPPELTFDVQPPTIREGESATLNWTVRHTTRLELNSNGTPLTPNSLVVSPNTSTEYALRASGFGSQTQTRWLRVRRNLSLGPRVRLFAHGSGQSVFTQGPAIHCGTAAASNAQPEYGEAVRIYRAGHVRDGVRWVAYSRFDHFRNVLLYDPAYADYAAPYAGDANAPADLAAQIAAGDYDVFVVTDPDQYALRGALRTDANGRWRFGLRARSEYHVHANFQSDRGGVLYSSGGDPERELLTARDYEEHGRKAEFLASTVAYSGPPEAGPDPLRFAFDLYNGAHYVNARWEPVFDDRRRMQLFADTRTEPGSTAWRFQRLAQSVAFTMLRHDRTTGSLLRYGERVLLQSDDGRYLECRHPQTPNFVDLEDWSAPVQIDGQTLMLFGVEMQPRFSLQWVVRNPTNPDSTDIVREGDPIALGTSGVMNVGIGYLAPHASGTLYIRFSRDGDRPVPPAQIFSWAAEYL